MVTNCILVIYKNEYFFEGFNLWRLLLIIAIHQETKMPINFWYRQRLNPRSLIQPSKTLPIELIGIFDNIFLMFFFFFFKHGSVK